MKSSYSTLLICFCAIFASAQTYDPHDFFLPAFHPPQGNEYRSPDGKPGPKYWQNQADYLIHATLNERDTSVTGDVTITYTNNSPHTLDYLWLQLDQNLFDPHSRGWAATPVSGDRFDVKGFNRGGYKIGAVSITSKGKNYPLRPVIADTRMQLRLPSPVLAHGGKISIKVNFSFEIPPHGADRLGRMPTKNGELYEIAQWYPRMCVYDDVEGWNTLPYMGLGEFYCEYGNFDYYITAPAGMIVYGSGDLLNPTEVLTTQQISRLAEARRSDTTVPIIKAEELGKPGLSPKTTGTLTWHFNMKNSRDVAWAASRGLIWDAARVNLPSGRQAIAMSAYPVESMGNGAYGRGTEYLKASIEIYSKNFLEYPWNSAVNIAGVVSGMEYPGMIFNSYREKGAQLWDLITHEIGHNWYPMIVGSNERRYMWMDEGLNTYINIYALPLFNNGEYAASKDVTSWYNMQVNTPPVNRRNPLMTQPEAMGLTEYGDYYNKTSTGLIILRDVILGRERFDYAFRKYTETWAFKHPTPYDFFNFMNNAAGDDLNWFWKEWFFTTWTLDQEVASVNYVDNDPAKGALITIANKGKMILPAIVTVTESDGKKGTVTLPVDVWQRGGTWTFRYASTKALSGVVLDEAKVLPDVNRANNLWQAMK
jgi:hypothetical protein